MVDWNKLWLDFKAIIPSASLFPPFTGNYLLHRERVVAFRYVVDFLNPGMLHDWSVCVSATSLNHHFPLKCLYTSVILLFIIWLCSQHEYGKQCSTQVCQPENWWKDSQFKLILWKQILFSCFNQEYTSLAGSELCVLGVWGDPDEHHHCSVNNSAYKWAHRKRLGELRADLWIVWIHTGYCVKLMAEVCSVVLVMFVDAGERDPGYSFQVFSWPTSNLRGRLCSSVMVVSHIQDTFTLAIVSVNSGVKTIFSFSRTVTVSFLQSLEKWNVSDVEWFFNS